MAKQYNLQSSVAPTQVTIVKSKKKKYLQTLMKQGGSVIIATKKPVEK